MEEQGNRFIEPENFFEGYQKSIDKLRNNPAMIEWDKLTYEIFEMNPQGKRWLEIAKERFLIPALAARGTATYQLDIIWAEGFKDFVRHIILALTTHQNRIQAGTMK